MRPLILKKKVIQGSQLEEAFPGTDSYGRPVVNIKFNSEARDIFYETTKRSVGLRHTSLYNPTTDMW